MRFLFPATAILLLAASPLGADDAVELGSREGLANFIAKIEKDRKAHVAFLGGSITQNAKGHSKMVPDWLEEKWPDVEFTFTNAGLSSTCSVAGAMRVEEDLLSKGAIDLLFLEFAVNDDQDARHDRETAIRGLEGVIRQYFEANPTGDILSVMFVNPEILELARKGEEAVSVAAHKEVARYYGLPIVDVGLALAAQIEAGSMTWDENYGGTHPNEEGYRFASDLIIRVIEDSVSGETPQTRTLPEPLDPLSYSYLERIDPRALNWLGGWKFAPVSKELLPEGAIRADYEKFQALRSDSAGDYLYHSFAGTMLGAFVLAGPDSGAVEISIDAGEWRKVDLHHHHSKSLNYPRAVILADDLDDRFHTVAIRTAKTDSGDGGESATFLYFSSNR